MLYLHTLTFPEVEEAKSSVVDIQGHLWAGPDRRGSNAPSRDALFLHWQKQVVMASRTSLDEIPAAVHEYFQKTKMLARAPRGDETIEMVSAPDGGYAAPAPVKRKHPNPPRFATSYSGMKDFLNCPLKWSAAKYWKTLPYIEGPEAAWGNRVHKALENVLRNIIIADDVKLIKEQGYEKYLKAILQAKKAGARVEAEQELCFTKDLKPCGWKSWDTVWFRFKGDVLVYNGPKVNYIDWKTGKRYSKRGDDQADTFQLEVAWAVVALHHPEVEEFSGSLIYLQEEDLTRAVVKRTYTRDDLPGIWEKIFSITRRMEEAWETENFRMQTSGLCKKYCGHTACPHCGA